MQDLFYKSPPTYEAYEKKLHNLSLKYDFMKLGVIGKSHLSRNIYEVRIGNANNLVLYAGAFHAQEWITTLLLVKFLEEVCESIKKKSLISDTPVYKTLFQRGLVIIPMLNPDGVEIALNGFSSAAHLGEYVKIIKKRDSRSWQANAIGVDLNHNFDAGFEIEKALEKKAGIRNNSPRQYGGSFAHSEPEVRAIVDFCTNNPVKSAFAFHSQGEEIFYKYGEHTPPQSRFIARLLSISSGYKLKENEGLASHGGFKDWFIEKLNLPAFTIEIGKGENPLPISELEKIYNKILEMLVIGMLC
ncbi:MAG: M14 family metallocarboxypeptidase [Oscillospiraceae bacterium]